MSRSYHQKHSTSHFKKAPRIILEVNEEGDPIYRKRKIKPFGRKDFVEEEVYSTKFGEHLSPIINKGKERRKKKISIYEDFSEGEN